jgi:hypothetical protein
MISGMEPTLSDLAVHVQPREEFLPVFKERQSMSNPLLDIVSALTSTDPSDSNNLDVRTRCERRYKNCPAWRSVPADVTSSCAWKC